MRALGVRLLAGWQQPLRAIRQLPLDALRLRGGPVSGSAGGPARVRYRGWTACSSALITGRGGAHHPRSPHPDSACTRDRDTTSAASEPSLHARMRRRARAEQHSWLDGVRSFEAAQLAAEVEPPELPGVGIRLDHRADHSRAPSSIPRRPIAEARPRWPRPGPAAQAHGVQHERAFSGRGPCAGGPPAWYECSGHRRHPQIGRAAPATTKLPPGPMLIIDSAWNAERKTRRPAGPAKP